MRRVIRDASTRCRCDAAVHRDGERLRAAHPAEPGRDSDRSCERAAEALPARSRRTSHRCPAGFPACRCRSTSRPSSGRTSSARGPRAAGTPPSSPSRGPGSSSRSARAAPTRACASPRPACRTAPAASRRRAGRSACARSRRTTPSRAPPCPRRRTRRAPRDARRPRGRGCSSASAWVPRSAMTLP